MNNRQQRTVKAFQAVIYLVDRGPVDAMPPLLRTNRDRLAAIVKRIQVLGSEQHWLMRPTNTNVERLRQRLRRERMMPLIRMAKPVLAWAPGTASAMRVPHARANAQVVATAALRLSRALTPHLRLLRAAGCEREVLVTLKREAQELARARSENDKARERLSALTAGIAQEFKKGMMLLASIEGTVLWHEHANPSMMRLWRQTRRVPSRMGRPKGKKIAISVPS